MIGIDVAGWTIPLVAFAVVLAVTISRPSHGLLLVTAATPIEPAIVGDAVALALLAGWLPRARLNRPGPTVVIPAVGLLLAGSLVARLGFVSGARAAEGIALAAATTVLFRRDPSLAVTLPAALALSAAAALMRLVFERTNGDGMDAGYFAMIGVLAIGMAARWGGYRRALWAVAAGISGIGFTLAPARRPLGGYDAGTFGAVAWILLTLWIGAGLMRTVRALLRAPRDSRLAGGAVGVVAFLVLRLPTMTIFTDGTARAFWIQFGLVTALAASTLLDGVSAATVATSSTLAPAIRTPPRR